MVNGGEPRAESRTLRPLGIHLNDLIDKLDRAASLSLGLSYLLSVAAFAVDEADALMPLINLTDSEGSSMVS